MALTACGGPSATPIVRSTPITPGSQPESAQTQVFTQPPGPTSTPQSVATVRPTLPTIVVPASSPTKVTKTPVVPTSTPAIIANAPTQKPVILPSPMPSRLEMMWSQRVEEAFAASDCPAARKLELEASDHKGPLIDAHFHMSPLWDAPLEADADGGSYERDISRGNFPIDLPILGKNITMTEIACRLGQEGIVGVLAFFYVESERPGQLRPSLDVVRKTMDLYPTLYVPFIQSLCCNETVPTVDAKTLTEYLEIYPGLFQGHGEIVLYDQPREGGGRKAEDYPPDAPLLLGVYQVARERQ